VQRNVVLCTLMPDTTWLVTSARRGALSLL